MTHRRPGAAVGWLLALAIVVACARARAHDFSPGVLSLVEVGPGRFDVAWTEPVDSQGAPGGVRVVFPPHCRHEQPRLDCGASGLHGPVAFEGMHAARMQVVVAIRRLDGRSDEQIVSGGAPRVEIAPAPRSTAPTWLRLGVEHILGGLDHLAFLIGLLLVVGMDRSGKSGALRAWTVPRRLVATITAFTVAHSLALALAVLDVVRLPSGPVEATIAASVLLVAREAMHDGRTVTRRRPWAVALLFGLVHGLGFAGALRQLGLPRGPVAWPLLWFNVGVEVGQLGLIALAVPAARLLDERLPAGRVRWLRVAACHVLGAVAAWWLIARVAAILRLS